MTDTTNPNREQQAREDFLAQLRRVNLARYEAWVDGADAGIMFDALELGGEVGELLNVVKKLEREERGWRGSRADPADFADECADVLICLDKLARRRGIDLEAATIAKFNATSAKVGLPQVLAALTPSQSNPDVPTPEAERVELPDGDMNRAKTIAMGHGKVDVGVIHWNGRSGILLHPREAVIPVGEDGELAGEYWPVEGDVVIWIDKPEGADVILKELAPLGTPRPSNDPAAGSAGESAPSTPVSSGSAALNETGGSLKATPDPEAAK